MDLESIYRWEDYSRAKDQMMVHTDIPSSPWYVVESDIKKHARLNMMAHLLSTIDYARRRAARRSTCPNGRSTGDYHRPSRELSTYVDDSRRDTDRRPRATAADSRRCGCTSRRRWPCCSSWSPTGRCSRVSGTAFAVTPTLRESYAEGDDDELAEVALREAALASLRLLAAEARRLGASAAARGAGGRRRRRRRHAATRSRRRGGAARRAGRRSTEVIAAYVDNAAAETAVRAAIEVVDEADLGDEDAELTVGDAQDHDLAWYATQELPFLLELL